MSLSESQANTLWQHSEGKSIDIMTFSIDSSWQKGQNQYNTAASEKTSDREIMLDKICHIQS